jgi:cellulose synthase/poly-beta-1,6-N-acetylglucosamine synthase-like glycosyltransferase
MILFYILATLLIFLSYKSFRGGINYLNYFKSELAEPRSGFTPFVSIIAPCKGLDEGLRENLSMLLIQEYPEYEVIFVVDDQNDAAAPIIEDISRKAATIAKGVVASKTRGSAQKIENLREGILHVSGRSEVFVFVDSDARPAKDWLRNLVAPLENKDLGAATGYRWFISKTPGFASEMRSVWNASVASALGQNMKSNFCWGGSTAMTREVFERLDVREKWLGTLSDDFTLTRILNDAGMSIYFVPKALTASVENCTFRELLEFTTRQMKITRVYRPDLWKMSFFGSGLFNVVWIWLILILVFASVNSFAFWTAVATLVVVSIFSIGKSWLRLMAVRLVFTEYEKELKLQFWPQNTLWLLSPALFFYNAFSALVSRRMTWRGIRYELKSARETVIISK